MACYHQEEFRSYALCELRTPRDGLMEDCRKGSCWTWEEFTTQGFLRTGVCGVKRTVGHTDAAL